MARKLTREELTDHKNNALKKMDAYLTKLIDSPDKKVNAKSNKLSYWLEDWTTFLDFESRFSPSSLKRYKRGEIIKVHLGYNVGSEEGGLHYAVIVEKDNSIHNPVITIVPLTSIKHDKDLAHLRKGEVLLGDELFSKFSAKFNETFHSAKEEYQRLQGKIQQFKDNEYALYSQAREIEKKQKIINNQLDLLEKMRFEISKMKNGSIALTNQITTISKIRIYDPKTTKDMFSGITLSDEGLTKIDEEIIRRYTK